MGKSIEEQMIETIEMLRALPNSPEDRTRENALAITKTEEALMWHRASMAGGVAPVEEATRTGGGCPVSGG